MIPVVIKATQFQFITVKDVTFSRNKPFWFNINYTVTSTGESKQKMKRFLSKAECRKASSVLEFCISIDEGAHAAALDSVNYSAPTDGDDLRLKSSLITVPEPALKRKQSQTRQKQLPQKLQKFQQNFESMSAQSRN